MPKPNEFVLLTATDHTKKTRAAKEYPMRYQIDRHILKRAIIKALQYAFVSLPFTNANIKSGASGTGLNITNRIENILKGKIAETIIVQFFGADGNFVKDYNCVHYIESYPKKTPYWLQDEVDAIKKNAGGRILAELDIKTLNIKWTSEDPPTLDQLSEFVLKRSPRAPVDAPTISMPLGILLEDPWRHFNKLLHQTPNRKSTARLEIPFNVLFGLCPQFTLKMEEFKPFADLYTEYYEVWKTNKKNNLKSGRLPFPGSIDLKLVPPELKEMVQEPETYPHSLHWVIDTWTDIQEITEQTAKSIEDHLNAYWIWVFGIATQQSAKYFVNIYQNDAIYYGSTKIWSSATRSPIEKKWTERSKNNYKQNPISDSDAEPIPKDLYLNNHAIDVGSESVLSMRAYLQ